MEINEGNGGLHGALKNVRREDCYLIDVDSFYPSIMIAYDLLPKCRHKARFPELLKLKRQGLKDVKLMINSVYGLMPENDRVRICKTGQTLMYDLIAKVGGELIQVNTDGLIVKGPNIAGVEAWEKQTGMITTSVHITKMVQRDVNNYMYLTDDDTLVIKGSLRKQGIAGIAVARSILQGTNLSDEIRKGKLLDYCQTVEGNLYYYEGNQDCHVCDFVRLVHVTDSVTVVIDGKPYEGVQVVMGSMIDYKNGDYNIDFSYYEGIARELYTAWTGRRSK